jgi:hypothetical protein
LNHASQGNQNKHNQWGRAGSRPLRGTIEGAQTTEERAAEKNEEYKIARRIACWTMITGIGTVVAAVLAGVAAWIFNQQLSASQAELTEQRAEFQLDQRPILTRVPIPPEMAPIRDGPTYKNMQYGWNYGVRNVGKGTALNVKMFEYISILGSHFIGIYGGIGRYYPDVGPTEFFWSTAYFGAPVSEERKQLAETSDNGIFIKVIIKYKDIFGTIYTSPICMITHANGSVAGCLISQTANIPTDGEEYERKYK